MARIGGEYERTHIQTRNKTKGLGRTGAAFLVNQTRAMDKGDGVKDHREDMYEDYIRFRYKRESGVIDVYYDALSSAGREILSYIETNEFANRPDFIGNLKKLANSLRKRP